jgi:alkyl hydroperoxide reductase subunit F
METLGIENVIGTKYTEGPKLIASIEEHVNDYDVDVMKLQRAKAIEKKDLIEVTLENGATLKTKNSDSCYWCSLA